MFEIGNSLHEARARRGVSLPSAEAATKIRAKYLKALEEEQFDALPAQTYVKGFLRTYAEFLGLEGQLYVDEYNSRFVIGDDDGRPLRPRRSNARPQTRSAGVESNVVLVTLAAIALVVALIIVAWKNGGAHVQTPPAATTGVRGQKRPAAASAPSLARLVLAARGGDSLLEVHVDSAAGRLLYQGTLLRGKSVELEARRLWIDATNVQYLRARLNGHPLALGVRRGHATMTVVPNGVQLQPAGAAPLG